MAGWSAYVINSMQFFSWHPKLEQFLNKPQLGHSQFFKNTASSQYTMDVLFANCSKNSNLEQTVFGTSRAVECLVFNGHSGPVFEPLLENRNSQLRHKSKPCVWNSNGRGHSKSQLLKVQILNICFWFPSGYFFLLLLLCHWSLNVKTSWGK